jgi:hypothetical protein
MDRDDTHMRRRKADKDGATAEIASALNRLTDERREPDGWERVYLVDALSSVFRGCYGLAITEVRLAMISPSERSPSAHLPYDPVFDRYDLTVLSKALRAAMAEPVQRFPHLGPIELTGAAAS